MGKQKPRIVALPEGRAGPKQWKRKQSRKQKKKIAKSRVKKRPAKKQGHFLKELWYRYTKIFLKFLGKIAGVVLIPMLHHASTNPVDIVLLWLAILEVRLS